jgi:hypothetical protein
MLTDMVRTDSHQLRAGASDSPDAEAVKVVARTHKTLIWERTRQVQRLRHQLQEYFPAALEAVDDLDAPDALELPGKTPDPAKAAKLTQALDMRLTVRPAPVPRPSPNDLTLGFWAGSRIRTADAARRRSTRSAGPRRS